MKTKLVRLSIFSALLAACAFASGCSTLADAKAGRGSGESRVYAAKPEKVWATLPAAVKSAGLEYVADNKTEGYALAQRGITFGSYGEHVAIFIDGQSSDQTKVEIVSKKAMATNIFAPNWAQPVFDKLTELLK